MLVCCHEDILLTSLYCLDDTSLSKGSLIFRLCFEDAYGTKRKFNFLLPSLEYCLPLIAFKGLLRDVSSRLFLFSQYFLQN